MNNAAAASSTTTTTAAKMSSSGGGGQQFLHHTKRSASNEGHDGSGGGCGGSGIVADSSGGGGSDVHMASVVNSSGGSQTPQQPPPQHVISVMAATPESGSDRTVNLQYTDTKVIGNGSFGVVYLAKLFPSSEDVAIKRVLQDKRFKNRELQIMRRLDHRNVVKLKYFFYNSGEKKEEVYLNLILEYVPETVYRVARHYSKQRQIIPILYIKIYMYQLFRALAYIHSLGICHRDIKPQNLLLNAQTSVLKLCDFGSAKVLVGGEPNVAYICSRYYRAPELIFGATDYTTRIDVWSAGTVLAELLLGQPFFPGDSGVDQLVEIIKVLGTPTREEIQEMNPNYTEFRFPMIRPHPWPRVFRPRTPAEAVDLVSQLLRYTPNSRLTPLEAMAHDFFGELRSPECKLPSSNPMPSLFDFSEQELLNTPSELIQKLLPGCHKSTTAGTGPILPSELATASTTGRRDGAAAASGVLAGQPCPTNNAAHSSGSQHNSSEMQQDPHHPHHQATTHGGGGGGGNAASNNNNRRKSIASTGGD